VVHTRIVRGQGSARDAWVVDMDGRRPGHRVGASFAESARIIRALGAADAVNLDGGGSTAMTVGGRPRDPTLGYDW
jgi:exopolysaccharide biosynthesis protein